MPLKSDLMRRRLSLVGMAYKNRTTIIHYVEWVSDCCLMPTQQFSAISWREQVNFQWDDDELRFVLDQHVELDFYSASSLKQQSMCRHVAPLWHIMTYCPTLTHYDMSPYSDTLSRFQANLSLLFLLRAI